MARATRSLAPTFRSAFGAFGAFVALLAGCGADGPPAFDHVFLVSIDTLRADHLGCYGSGVARTPRLDAFASEGVLFEQHVVVAPVTLPSHASLMTGTYPRRHGTPRNGFVVSDDNTLLAERLRDAGFATAGFVAAVPLASTSGFAQGFDHYDEPERRVLREDTDPALTRRADWMTDRVLAWLDGPGGDAGRMFVFVHYFDVHYPYENGEPWDSMYRREGMPPGGGSMADLARLRAAWARGDASARALSRARAAAYAGGVTFTDREVGRLVDGLRERDLLERSVVIVTSDHGETMDAHPEELWDHGRTLFDETMRVPLLMRFPGGWRAGTRIVRLVANVDVAPTLLEWIGLPSPGEIDGLSFAAAVAGERMRPRPAVMLEAMKPDDPATERGVARWRNERKQRAARDAQWKVIERPRTGAVHAYDLVLDPLETRPQPVDAGTAPGLRAALAEWNAQPVHAERRQRLDDATRARLRALGYAD